MSKKKEYIAIISEGEKTEKQIINNLENNFTTFSNKIIFLSYKTNIYNLFREIVKLFSKLFIICFSVFSPSEIIAIYSFFLLIKSTSSIHLF